METQKALIWHATLKKSRLAVDMGRISIFGVQNFYVHLLNAEFPFSEHRISTLSTENRWGWEVCIAPLQFLSTKCA